MIYKKNSKLGLPVLVLALTVPGLAVLVGSQQTQTLTAAAAAGTYAIDPLHTNVGFRVRHMGLAIVVGKFTDYTATISYFPNDITEIFGAVYGEGGESRHGRQTARRPSAERRLFRGGEISGHDVSIDPNRTQER